MMSKTFEIFKFLNQLAVNNSKEWMDANRSWYHECRDHFKEISQELIEEISKFDHSIEGLGLKESIYRINRNNRFQKDLPPYKEYLAISISKGGKKSPFAEYYFHLSPGNRSYIGGGLWGPEPKQLLKIRQEIDYNPDPLLKLLNNKKFKNLFGSFHNFNKLKTAPRGYSKDHENIDLLRHKHFAAFQSIPDEDFKTDHFKKLIVNSCKVLLPLVTYLNEAVEEEV